MSTYFRFFPTTSTPVFASFFVLFSTLMLSQIISISHAASSVGNVSKNFPRPGLYQVDTRSESKHLMGEMVAKREHITNGVTGDETSIVFGENNQKYETHATTGKPNTICIKPPSKDDLSLMYNLPHCTNQSTKFTETGYTVKATCGANMLTNLTVRKLSDDQWEFVTEVHVTGGGMMDNADIKNQRKALEAMAASNDPEARKVAKGLIEELRKMEKSLPQAREQHLALLNKVEKEETDPVVLANLRQSKQQILGKAPSLISKDIQIYTRVSDHCN